jgi:hypothetical protein
MKFLTDFLGLLYDLVVGDCWQIAAGAAIVLGLGIVSLKIGAIPASYFSSVLGPIIMLAAALIIYFEARISYASIVRKGDNDENSG